MRIATFGLRSVPPTDGSGGSDTFTAELYSRLAARGHAVTVYCRVYDHRAGTRTEVYEGMNVIRLSTTTRSGFDTLVHSFRSTLHILLHDTGDVVHIQNGGNSIWAFPLRLSGKRIIIGQDGFDWKREKWKWYGRMFLKLSMYILACCPATLIFDNIYTKSDFEKKFKRKCLFIPYGADVAEPRSLDMLKKYGLEPKSYILFIGRFIPDKGVHFLIRAFESTPTDKRLVIVGGSPNPGSAYEQTLRSTRDSRIMFPGYVYGDSMLQLLKGCYCYVQPSEIEGLSPMLLTAMGLGVPVICSNLRENVYAVGDAALLFDRGHVASLQSAILKALTSPDLISRLARDARNRAKELFSWEKVTDTYEEIFSTLGGDRDRKT